MATTHKEIDREKYIKELLPVRFLVGRGRSFRKMRLFEFEDKHNPIVITWQTKMAKFIHIEISPSHIFRVKIDKVAKKKKEEVS